MADQLRDKVDLVVAQMREMLADHGLEGYNTIWCHKIRDWMKVLGGEGLTVDDFAHYADPNYPNSHEHRFSRSLHDEGIEHCVICGKTSANPS